MHLFRKNTKQIADDPNLNNKPQIALVLLQFSNDAINFQIETHFNVII